MTRTFKKRYDSPVRTPQDLAVRAEIDEWMANAHAANARNIANERKIAVELKKECKRQRTGYGKIKKDKQQYYLEKHKIKRIVKEFNSSANLGHGR
jgi:hypothetical protein